MNMNLEQLTTEQQNEHSRHIDKMPAIDIIKIMNQEDRKVAEAVERCLPEIAAAVDAIVRGFQSGGRLLYYGAGTSGRLGILDASECPPTFGTDPEQVIGVIAGGDKAVHSAVEGAEDDELLGVQDVDRLQVNTRDTVVGISASGRTPYVIGAMKRAKELGATVIGIANNNYAEMRPYAHIMIEAVIGSEVILGSTRLKAGTAQKLILNMLTTASMILCGKVYDNLMVDMQSSNEKLIERAKRLIELATGADKATIERTYQEADYHVKTAIVMIMTGTAAHIARRLLDEAGGFVHKAIGIASKQENGVK